ncbi:MAG: T9SS type A sorting domain-containing protein [Bacteroidetes bacterium]|nr:T9SS type A sorting domain-containing protein [Bacteroidota bacterium]
MKRIFTLSMFLIGLFLNSNAQHRCGSMDALEQEKLDNPKGYQHYLEAKEMAENWLANPNNQNRMGADTIVIPVVFHVIYKTADQNISNQRIAEQIDILNKDFARLNADASNTPSRFQSIASGIKIKFCLANRDPNGNPTTGIERKLTTLTSFSPNDSKMKLTSDGGLDGWNRNKYLNLWTCNITGGILGFATFPGGTASLDGVVLLYSTVGNGTLSPYNKGRTATHEVGHWMGLYHIWSSIADDQCTNQNSQCTDSDNIGDTPNQCGATYGCPSGIQTDFCNNTANGIMYMNYMDYVNDNCMNMFTVGQIAKVQSILNTSRSAILTSDGCSGSNVVIIDAQPLQILAPTGASCLTTFTPSVKFRNNGNGNITALQFTFGTVGSSDSLTFIYNGTLAPGATINLTSSNVFTRPAGSYTFFARVRNVNGANDNNLANNYLTGPFTVGNASTAAIPFFDGFESNNFPVNYTLIPSNADSTWKVTNTAKKTGTYSLFINYFDYQVKGAKDEFILPSFNLSSINNPILVFDRAYAQYTFPGSGTISDTLEVWVENGCGTGFQRVYRKFGNTLDTDTATRSFFKPTFARQWESDTINLSAYAGSLVNIKFRGINRYANNLYLENINVKANPTTGIKQNTLNENRFTVFPNPNTGKFNVQYIGEEATQIELKLYDLAGKSINEYKFDANIGLNNIPIELGNKYTGQLLIQINDGKSVGVRKIFVQ